MEIGMVTSEEVRLPWSQSQDEVTFALHLGKSLSRSFGLDTGTRYPIWGNGPVEG